jgi:acyl carrier protein
MLLDNAIGRRGMTNTASSLWPCQKHCLNVYIIYTPTPFTKRKELSMKVSSAVLIKGLHEIFPDCETMALSSDTMLGDLPEWDSMAAVNFQTYLEQQFNLEVPIELLADSTSLNEVMEFIANPVPI